MHFGLLNIITHVISWMCMRHKLVLKYFFILHDISQAKDHG